MKYKHVNQGRGIIRIYDSKGIGYDLRPGDEAIIDKISQGNGVIMTEEIKDIKKPKGNKQGDDIK